MQITSAAAAQATVDPAATPASRVLNRYGNALFALPGVTNLRYRPTVGDAVTVLFRTEQDRQIGSMVLEDAIDGVQLLTEVSEWTGGSPDPDPSLWKHQAAIAAVGSLPGVWNSITWSGGWEGNGTVRFQAINQRTVDLLDPLVRDRIEGPTRADGTIKWYDVEWSAGVPG